MTPIYMDTEEKQKEILVGIMRSNGSFAPCEIHFGEFETVPGDADAIARFPISEDSYRGIEPRVLDLCDNAKHRGIPESELVRQLTQVFADAVKAERGEQ
jgi:hypothetical protein